MFGLVPAELEALFLVALIVLAQLLYLELV